MAAADANVFPAKNAAFRLAVSFRKNDGALITSWTGAASTVATDASSASGGTPTEIGTTGLGYLDLTSGQMNGELIQVKCTVTNTDALPFVQAIYTGGLAEMQAALPTNSSIATAVAAALTIPTASQIATQVWGTTLPDDASGFPTTMSGAVTRIITKLSRRSVKSGDVVSSYANNSTTVVATEGYSITSTGFDKSKDA